MDNLYVKEVQGKGRGVFSKKDIKAGEIVEIAPVVIFEYNNLIQTTEQTLYENGQKVLLKNVVYNNNIPCEIDNIIFNWSSLIKNIKKESAIALGYGSLYNAANPSNMRYEANELKKTLIFIAVIDIPKDTELTINYSGLNGSHICEDNYWFKEKNIDFKG